MIRKWISDRMQAWAPNGRHELPNGLIIDTQTGEWTEADDPARASRMQLIRSSPIQAAVRLISHAVADLVSGTIHIVNEERGARRAQHGAGRNPFAASGTIRTNMKTAMPSSRM